MADKQKVADERNIAKQDLTFNMCHWIYSKVTNNVLKLVPLCEIDPRTLFIDA